MKIQYMSDLHLEFDSMPVPEKRADILVLAGDIHTGTNAIPWIEQCSFVFDHVIYILGNHEYYGNCIQTLPEKIHRSLEGYSGDDKIFDTINNVHFLNNDSIVIDDVCFIGSTLWSKADPMLLWKMNDFSKIKFIHNGAYGKFLPEDARTLHNINVTYLLNTVHTNLKNVIITHHAPSYKSSNYKRDDFDIVSTGYCTDILEYFKNDNVAAWIHGHTHHCVDYVKSGIRVVSNQRGYVPYEPVYGFNSERIIEV